MTEDRRTTLAVLLCIVVVMFYSEIFLAPVSRQQLQNQPASPTSETKSTSPTNITAPPSTSVASPALSSTTSNPDATKLNAAPTIRVVTPLMHTTVTSLGGRIRSLRLSQYKEHLNAPEALEIVQSVDSAPLPLGLLMGNFSDSELSYSFEVRGGQFKGDTVEVASNETASITMRATAGEGTTVTKTLTFSGDSYIFKVVATRSSSQPNNAPLALEWSRHALAKAASQFDLENFTVLSGGKISYVTPDSLYEQNKTIPDVTWIGVGNRYFLTSLMSQASSSTGMVAVQRLDEHNNLLLSRVIGSSAEVSASIFTGPKEIKVLEHAGNELFRSVDLGWFSFLAHPLLALLRFFNGIFHNFGLAIIALTLFIKIGFLPLTRASFHSMKQMSEIQPEIKALRERIKDATELNQAIMKLYKDRGINPLGGCLPVFIQIPVFLGLYNALIHAIELRHAPFALWIHDLSAPEALHVFGIGVPVMVLLFGASMFIQQLQTPSTLDPAQKKIMLAMPVIFTFFFLGFPSGLTLYWLVNNAISIVQQATLRETKRFSPMTITLFASAVIFSFAYFLTLI